MRVRHVAPAQINGHVLLIDHSATRSARRGCQIFKAKEKPLRKSPAIFLSSPINRRCSHLLPTAAAENERTILCLLTNFLWCWL